MSLIIWFCAHKKRIMLHGTHVSTTCIGNVTFTYWFLHIYCQGMYFSALCKLLIWHPLYKLLFWHPSYIFFLTNRSCRKNKLKIVVDGWRRCYKGVYRYTYEWTKQLTSVFYFFQRFHSFFSKIPGNIGEFSDYLQTSLPTFQILDFFQTFQTVQTCRHHI